MGSVALHQGDMREVLAGLEEASIDAVVCDPPYELAFMGKPWDASGVSFDPETWRACLRVLKPGGHLLAFGGTRTVHRIAVAIEDAGFEIRDQIVWMYGSGFPKSLDVSKAMDKTAGAEREVIGTWKPTGTARPSTTRRGHSAAIANSAVENQTRANVVLPITAPATDLARQYAGFGTALKPAHEPIIVARKPLIGTVAANVTAHGTGALNIDGCRIKTTVETWPKSRSYASSQRQPGATNGTTQTTGEAPVGRWPANVCLDETAAEMLDAQSGVTTSAANARHNKARPRSVAKGAEAAHVSIGHSDTGGASRFFYVAKASRAERNAGLDGMAERISGGMQGTADLSLLTGSGNKRNNIAANYHPTVKPVALMRWLVRLVTPPDGVVCDPFLGSGTTGIAAVLEDMGFVGIEQSAEYLEIARRRIAHAQGPLFAQVAD